jgi:uncharacterized membrane protein YkvA (DUF1232 family)
MHDHRGRMGWLVVLGIYWLVQIAYLLSPIDFIPDVVPFFGMADDLLTLLISFAVTGVSVYKALPALPDAPRALDSNYEPLSADEIEAL